MKVEAQIAFRFSELITFRSRVTLWNMNYNSDVTQDVTQDERKKKIILEIKKNNKFKGVCCLRKLHNTMEIVG